MFLGKSLLVVLQHYSKNKQYYSYTSWKLFSLLKVIFAYLEVFQGQQSCALWTFVFLIYKIVQVQLLPFDL